MRERHRASRDQASLFPSGPNTVELPEATEREVVGALADLLLEAARARVKKATEGDADESEDHA
jgi:hypothetical protein